MKQPVRLGAGKFLRQVPFLLLLLSGAARAEPFAPANDGVVLEHLPDGADPAARALRARHRALEADPHNLALALDVARADLGRGRALGDPRFLGRAEAALAAWPPNDRAPPDVTLLRAVILQSNHDFPGALKALAQVLQARPGDTQAWLTRASIHQVQAEYPAALADCGQFAIRIAGLAADICSASVMSLTGHAPLALRAVSLSLDANKAEAARAPPVALWGLTLAAETADRLGDPSAEAWFGRAMALDPADPYLLGAWSDWLLDHKRPREVITLLAGRTRIDPLLLRLALAEQAVGDPACAGHIADLAARFEASRLRGDTVHRREEARFALFLQHDPARALALARANWEVQREPADARILVEAGDALPVLRWMRASGVQDRRLEALGAKGKQSFFEKKDQKTFVCLVLGCLDRYAKL